MIEKHRLADHFKDKPTDRRETFDRYAVRYLCPCHAGWELFEQHVGVLNRLLKDPSDVVRRHALHVFEDAARMQSRGDLEYCVEAGEKKIGEKRASRFRSME